MKVAPSDYSLPPAARPDAVERTLGWWVLWKKVYEPVEQIYLSFPTIHASCTVGDVVDYTTDEMYPRLTTINSPSLLHYARRVARHFCLRLKRQQDRNDAAGWAYSALHADPGDPYAASEPLLDVTPEQCLAALRELCNKEEITILYLHFYNDKSYVDIAGLLRMNENTVRSHARRALRRLYHHFTPNHRKI